MRRTARRQVLRAAGRRAALRPRGLRRPPAPAGARGGRDRFLVPFLVCLALLLWTRWSGPAAGEPARSAPPVATTAAAEPAAERPRKLEPRAPRPTPAAPVDPKRLRDAVIARASDLEPCARGAPSIGIAAGLQFTRAGRIGAVHFANAEPLPPALEACLREVIAGWSFPELHLERSVEALVTLRLEAR